MKIRSATLDDVPAFVEIGRRIHGMTRFKAFEFNAERLAQNLEAVVKNAKGTHCFLVAENDNGEAVGGLIGCVESHFFSDQLVASVVHYDVLPEKRMTGAGLRLLVAFRKWAENRGAFEISAGVNSGHAMDKMDRFLRRLGFRQTGGNYSLLMPQSALGKQRVNFSGKADDEQ